MNSAFQRQEITLQKPEAGSLRRLGVAGFLLRMAAGILLMAVGSMRGLTWVPLHMHRSLPSKDQAERLRGKSAEVCRSLHVPSHPLHHAKALPIQPGWAAYAADRVMITSSV